MKTELVQALTATFEAHAKRTEEGVEFWLARDIQLLLGYDEWRNFTAVITKAKTACETSGHPVPNHFVDVNKTIKMPKGAQREIPDLEKPKSNSASTVSKVSRALLGSPSACSVQFACVVPASGAAGFL